MFWMVSENVTLSPGFVSHIPGTPRPTIYKWLFQLDDSQSLHRKWLEITKHPFFNGCLGFQVYDMFDHVSGWFSASAAYQDGV